MDNIVCISIPIVIYIILTVVLWLNINIELKSSPEYFRNIEMDLGGNSKIESGEVEVTDIIINEGGKIKIGGFDYTVDKFDSIKTLNQLKLGTTTVTSSDIKKLGRGGMFQLNNLSGGKGNLRKKSNSYKPGLWSGRDDGKNWTVVSPSRWNNLTYD